MPIQARESVQRLEVWKVEGRGYAVEATTSSEAYAIGGIDVDDLIRHRFSRDGAQPRDALANRAFRGIVFTCGLGQQHQHVFDVRRAQVLDATLADERVDIREFAAVLAHARGRRLVCRSSQTALYSRSVIVSLGASNPRWGDR